MKKLFFGLLSSLLILSSCHKGEEEVLPNGEEIEYAVTVGVNDISFEKGQLKSSPLKSTILENGDVNVNVYCYKEKFDDDGKSLGYQFYTKIDFGTKQINPDASSPAADRNYSKVACLPKGEYKLYAILCTPNIRFDQDTKIGILEGASVLSDYSTKTGFWINNEPKDLTVEGNCNTTINVERHFSSVRWQLEKSDVKVENVQIQTNIFTSYDCSQNVNPIVTSVPTSYDNNYYQAVKPSKIHSATLKDSDFELRDHDAKNETDQIICSNIEIFTFPGSEVNGMNVSVNYDIDNNNQKPLKASLPLYQKNHRYTLRASLGSSMKIVVKEQKWDDTSETWLEME